MKPIWLSKDFEKAYKHRVASQPKLRAAYITSVKAFSSGQRDYPLHDHPLKGKLTGKRAFSVANDLCVIYQETADQIIFLDIGSHNQVYG